MEAILSHPYKSSGHKNDPKWLGGVRKYDAGGEVKPLQVRRLNQPSFLPPYLKSTTPYDDPPPRRMPKPIED